LTERRAIEEKLVEEKTAGASDEKESESDGI